MRPALYRLLTLLSLVTAFQTVPAQRRVVAVVPRRSLDSITSKAPDRPLIRVSGERTERISSTKDTVTLRAGELLLHETGAVPTVDVSRTKPHFDLPTAIRSATADGDVAGFTIAIELQALAFDARDDQFVGTMHIGLDDSLHRQGEQLAAPIEILLSSPHGEATFDAVDLRLSHTNLPFTPVRLVASGMAGDSVLVHVRPSFNSGYSFYVPLLRPMLRVTVSPTRIAGFGLEKARVTVELPTTDSAAQRTVSLHGKLGDPVPGRLTLAARGSGATILRSNRIGVDTIEARSDPLKAGVTEIRYEFPTLFLMAAFLGGALGGLARRFGISKGVTFGRSRAYLYASLRGVVVGLIAAVAYAAGVNLVGVAIPLGVGEAGVFTAAALGVLFDLNRPGATRHQPA